MTHDTVSYESRDRVAIITINRPEKMNAISPAVGEALRRACDSVPERIALVGTGGISHWPATPDSGKINEEWDRDFLDRLMRQDKAALLSTRMAILMMLLGRVVLRSAPTSLLPRRQVARANSNSIRRSCRFSRSVSRLRSSRSPRRRAR